MLAARPVYKNYEAAYEAWEDAAQPAGAEERRRSAEAEEADDAALKEAEAALSEAEDAAILEGEWTACESCRDPVKARKALGYLDAWGPDIRIVNARRARTRYSRGQ